MKKQNKSKNKYLKQARRPVPGLDTITGSHVKGRVCDRRNGRKSLVENCPVKRPICTNSGCGPVTGFCSNTSNFRLIYN